MKKLRDLIKDGNISSEVKFKLMDVMEMRENNWVPVKQRLSQISTIEQVTENHNYVASLSLAGWSNSLCLGFHYCCIIE